MTDLIIRWGDVLPGDQALDEARLITVTEINVRPQEGHPDFLIAYVGGHTEEGRGVSTSPPADSLTAVRRDERCPECHVPLSMHHDPMCSQPYGKCEAAKVTPTLTVATPRGADVLAASEWDRLNGGGLLASDNNGNLVAEYAPGGWHGVVKDSARAPSGPGSTEALLGEIEEAASGEDTAVERLEAVREILRRWRKAGK